MRAKVDSVGLAAYANEDLTDKVCELRYCTLKRKAVSENNQKLNCIDTGDLIKYNRSEKTISEY